MAKALIFILTLLMTSACTTPEALIKPNADNIEIRIDQQFDPESCIWLGDVTGSVGHWYNYLFYANDLMTRGALNDLRNNALSLGADTVYMVSLQDFATSMTLFGVAYQCHSLS